MKRLAGYLAISLLISLGACGSGKVSPSMLVKAGPYLGPFLQFKGRQLMVFTLTPNGQPSGVIAFKSVQAGHVATLGSATFADAKGLVAVAVELSGSGIDVGWQIAGRNSWLTGGPAVLPEGSVAAGSAWMESRRVGVGDLVGEQVIWVEDFWRGGQPESDKEILGNFDALVKASKQAPGKTLYCLTLNVDRQ